MENTYCVYIHTLLLDGRKYIGITKNGTNPEKRWLNGRGYKTQSYFYNAIEKYGWDAFKHEVLFNELSKEQACLKEKALIKLFNTTDRMYGFNLTTGGEHYEATDETKQKISSANKKFVFDFKTLYFYYIDLDWSELKIADYFGCSDGVISKELHKYGIEKDFITKKKPIAYNELYTKYIIEDYTFDQCVHYFNCSETTLYNYLVKYNIKKENYRTKRVEINRDELYYQYVVLDKTRKECAIYFNCSKHAIDRRLAEYNIKKKPI